MTEHTERLPRGPKGDRGEQGAQGAQGTQGASGPQLPRKVRNALVFLFVFSLLLGVGNLFWTAHLVREANHAKCGTVVTLATIPVPTGDITVGAHAFDKALTAAFAQRARELGCKKGDR